MKAVLTLLLVLPVCAVAQRSQDGHSYEQLVHHFDFDHSAPLNTRQLGVTRRGEIRIVDLTYASPRGGVVPAALVVPDGKGPFAAVIWGHWYMPGVATRNRTEFLDEAVALARTGVISLLPDAVIARPGYVARNGDTVSDADAEEFVHEVLDMSRGADLLLARKDVDPQRLAYVGHSFNASIGAVLAGVDKRFTAFVLMAGSTSDEVDLKGSYYQQFRQKIGPEKFDAFVAKYHWLDPALYVSQAAPAAVFLQFASKDPDITLERVEEYAAVVSEPRQAKIYDAEHNLNAEARRDRIAFLTGELKLRALPQEVIATIPETKMPEKKWP